MNDNNATQNVQNSLATDTIPVDVFRMEVKCKRYFAVVYDARWCHRGCRCSSLASSAHRSDSSHYGRWRWSVWNA